MCSLNSFPSPPPKGQATLCEFESFLIAACPGADIRNYTDQLNMYPQGKISGDTLRPSASREIARNAFIHREEPLWKAAAMAWHERGFMGVLEELSRNSEREGNLWCHWSGLVARRIIGSLRWLHSLHGSIYPHLMLSNEELSQQFAQTPEWLKGPVRAFAWHPQTIKYAVASHDDSVHIHTANSVIVPILKHKLQKGITDMGWKPYCASVLAVACYSGILIWQIDPTSLITRPSSSCMTLLSRKGHGPVTSIAWHPDGSYLASSSAADTTMHVWDVCMEISTPLRRFGGGGVSLLKWSPDGERLLAATPSSLFRVWETQYWTCERWSKLAGRCQAACWSPDGRILLFTNLEEPTVYFLTFNSYSDIQSHSIGGSKLAVPMIDVAEVMASTGNEEIRIFTNGCEVEKKKPFLAAFFTKHYEFLGVEVWRSCLSIERVGGRIHQMVWDKTGERLAISFKDNSEIIAVFRTKIKPSLEISSCGYIRGMAGEYPQLMSFHDNFTEGALFTVCWSSGRISHIPFLFLPVSKQDTLEASLRHTALNVSGGIQRRQTLFTDM